MKFLLSAILAGAASLVAAQDYNTSDPFTLQLQSDNDEIDGIYLSACHSGAAIEELCLAGKDAGVSYMLNSTGEDVDTGVLVYILQTASINVSSGLTFSPSLTSNVVTPFFQPSTSNFKVAFDSDEKLFIYSGSYDESTFTDSSTPTAVDPEPLYQWYACWTYSLGYYYHTLSWVTYGEPVNPTCESVNVTREFV